MPQRKKIIEVNGVVGTIDEHIARSGYSKSTIYHKAAAAHLSLEDYLNGSAPVDVSASTYVQRTKGDPFEKGFQWDIQGCENVINFAIEQMFDEMVDVMVVYLQKPTDRRRLAVRYYEGWFRDAIPNYYEISPDFLINGAWKKAREKVAEAKKHKAASKAKKGT